jgi:hypothetical protein
MWRDDLASLPKRWLRHRTPKRFAQNEGDILCEQRSRDLASRRKRWLRHRTPKRFARNEGDILREQCSRFGVRRLQPPLSEHLTLPPGEHHAH